MAKVLVKMLAILIDGLIGDVQTDTIPNRSIHDNLHLIRYFIERVGKEPGMSVVLINLDQSKAFNRVNHQYLEAVLALASFGLNFRGWITAMYSDTALWSK